MNEENDALLGLLTFPRQVQLSAGKLVDSFGHRANGEGRAIDLGFLLLDARRMSATSRQSSVIASLVEAAWPTFGGSGRDALGRGRDAADYESLLIRVK